MLFGSSLSAFDTANKEMVALLYKLYKDLTEPKARIAAMLLEHIKKLGVDEVEEFAKNEKAGTTRPDDGAKFIQNLVDIHRHFVMMFDECCDGETTFHQQLKDAYVKFIINNDELGDPHFIPSNLAIFCDTFLERKSAKKSAKSFLTRPSALCLAPGLFCLPCALPIPVFCGAQCKSGLSVTLICICCGCLHRRWSRGSGAVSALGSPDVLVHARQRLFQPPLQAHSRKSVAAQHDCRS
eukprot:SAG31_NODE_1186_length_9492_cov_70.124987_10_plen_239_part_00